LVVDGHQQVFIEKQWLSDVSINIVFCDKNL
jgi:hypothetical protein